MINKLRQLILINRLTKSRAIVNQLQVNRNKMEFYQSTGMIFYLVNLLNKTESFSNLISLILLTL